MTKKFLAFVAAAFLLAGCAPSEEIQTNIDLDTDVEDLPSVEEVEEVIEDIYTPEENDGEVIGSCNVIGQSSTCIDYIGSVWTWQIIELGCTGEGMTPSHDACPTGSIGGCQVGAGTTSEMITWFYNYGGDPVDAETEPYAAGACNATLGAQWTAGN